MSALSLPPEPFQPRHKGSVIVIVEVRRESFGDLRMAFTISFRQPDVQGERS